MQQKIFQTKPYENVLRTLRNTRIICGQLRWYSFENFCCTQEVKPNGKKMNEKERNKWYNGMTESGKNRAKPQSSQQQERHACSTPEHEHHFAAHHHRCSVWIHAGSKRQGTKQLAERNDGIQRKSSQRTKMKTQQKRPAGSTPEHVHHFASDHHRSSGWIHTGFNQ